MATIEHCVDGLQAILTEDLPAALSQIQAEWNDGIRLDPIRTFELEEMRGAIKNTPAALILGMEEDDPIQRDQIRDATVLLYIIITDRAKTHLTRKLYRYADAVRRVLRTPLNRTLRGVIVSAKVVRVKYSPTFVNRDNLFSRDLEATITLRVPRGSA